MNEFLNLLHTTIRMTTPIALAALGGLLGFRAGVLNVGLEGFMLSSAFVSVIVSYLTGNVFLAVILGICSSLILGLLFSLFGISLKGNLTIIGLAINTLVAGLTSYILQVFFGQRGTFSNNQIIGINTVDIPILRNIPILNRLLNNHTPIVYISFVLLAVSIFILYKTKFGIYIRTVGESPDAAEAVGINIIKIKYLSILVGGIYCGLAGANISLENVSMFVENMTGGRGFIAIAAIYSGGGTPLVTYLYSIIFGFADALQIRLQTSNIPGAFVQMIPYLTIILVLAISGYFMKIKEKN
ncbi:ABC transporter permease [Tuanshanicoccus lijuaniae]|uniref:ABC transporter permease n=1 Tax=Aerococcaceae bacterium zg-1292 TaxID=2774330 RepID=UPI001936F58D|nr:ABC transporter permease [Aerococcaceae bacterium zg-1292]QQA36612.1 ABC transporter permease [Aerococcaceae bacterium zg-1292]